VPIIFNDKDYSQAVKNVMFKLGIAIGSIIISRFLENNQGAQKFYSIIKGRILQKA
jgi:predicted MFS family arabinose efflux permease